MKNTVIKPFFIFFILISVILGCKTKNLSQDYSMPDIINPTYSIYNAQGEKGYDVNFELSKGNLLPSAIVLNNIKQGILSENIKGNSVNINIITETKMNNYKITPSENTANGLIFNINGKYYLKPVDFKLISN